MKIAAAPVDWAQPVAEAIVDSGVSLASIVPDSVTSKIFAHLEGRLPTVAISREEEGVGILGGCYLAGGFGALLMQNTGMVASLNAIGGYALPAGIAMLLVVNMRGDIGEFSPAQVPIGVSTEPTLRSLGIPYFSLESADKAQFIVSGAVKLAKAMHRPSVVLLRTQLHGGKAG